MPQKNKDAADGRLIKKLFAFQPIDWARYPDGKLSFVSPTGQKYTYTPEDLDHIEADLKAQAAARKAPRKAAPKKSAAKKDHAEAKAAAE